MIKLNYPLIIQGFLGFLSFFLQLLPPAYAVEDPGWPRVYSDGTKKLILYQPQIDEWSDYKQISFRSAFALTIKKELIYGIIEVNSPTVVDREKRVVEISNLDFVVRLPEVPEDKVKDTEKIVRSLLPHKKSSKVSLDRVITYLDPGKSSQRNVEVSLDPPPIFYSDRSAKLIIFVGKPVFKPIANTDLMFAVNTNWTLFLEQKTSRYYLLNSDTWLSTTDPMNGKWSAVSTLPSTFLKLPKDENWKDVWRYIPARKPTSVPRIFASSKPAELILTSGVPTFSAVEGTQLMFVTNSKSPVFMFNPNKEYYFLVAGRWFKSHSLDGPWSSATHSLPNDFLEIPPDHPMSFVRSSIPGTDEAADAVLLASIPQTTTVNRKDAKLKVDYDGKPIFKDVNQTSVQYAVNTQNDVFKVGNSYYACFNGVWFVSSDATGPWVLADNIPKEIYSIPVDHPKHNVTYVTVSSSNSKTVTTSQTGGYSGQYVSSGLLMFGAGVAIGALIADDNDDHYHYYYPPPPIYYSYGGGAYYDYHSGGYYRHASAYGPYGGAGKSAYYNPATGAFSRSATAVDPGGASFVREGYNPHTDTYAARAGNVTPFGASTRGYASRGDEWVKGGQNANAKGRTAWAETSDGGKAVAYDKRGAGGYGGVAKSDSGDVYAGKNGSVYKHDNDGGWYKREGDDWNQIEKSESNRAEQQQKIKDQQAATQTKVKNQASKLSETQASNAQSKYQEKAASRSSTASNSYNSKTSTRSSYDRSNSHSQLNFDSYARERGNSLSSRSSSSARSQHVARPSGGYSGGRGGRGGGRRR